MSWFKNIFEKRENAPFSEKTRAFLTGNDLFDNSSSGVYVDEKTAMRTSAVFACVRVLSETVASLPLQLYRRDGNGKSKAYTHPLYRILHDCPNQNMTSFVFRESMMTSLLLWGNAYAQIIRST